MNRYQLRCHKPEVCKSLDNRKKMESLEISFAILAGCGIWKPVDWPSEWIKKLFNIWRIIVFPMPYCLASAQLARMILVDMSFDELTEILFIFLSIINLWCKSISFVLQRKNLIGLSNMLSWDCASPQDDDETDIQNQYRQFIRYITLSSVILVETTAVTFLIPPFFQAANNRSLPFKIWLPYDYSSEMMFWMTYVPESITIINASLISVSSNTLIFGFLIEACIQLELLSYRFNMLPQYVENAMLNEKPSSNVYQFERDLIIRTIRHHIFIYKFVDALKKTFSSAILGQYVVSSLVISMSVYQLSTNKSIDVVFFTNLLYLMCMLLEFFFYCWFGNELSLKSEALGTKVFQINWVALSSKSNKNILIAILRSSKPVVVSSGFFVILSLESFTKILKLSYSAFSLLRTASE